MQPKIYIEFSHLKLIQAVFNKHLPMHSKVWVFGSRATGKVKKFSDLDLAIDKNGECLTLAGLADIENEFDESDLPYKVDIVDWNAVNEPFKKLIEKNRILLWQN